MLCDSDTQELPDDDSVTNPSSPRPNRRRVGLAAAALARPLPLARTGSETRRVVVTGLSSATEREMRWRRRPVPGMTRPRFRVDRQLLDHDRTVLTVVGELDVATAREFKEIL